MRHKLFWKLGLSHLLLLLIALAVVYAYTARAVERHVLETTFSHLESLVRMAGERPPDVRDLPGLQGWTSWLATAGARVTVIARDGVVLADSAEDPARMENHADRPEVRAALATGRGRASRYSETVDRDLVYLAVRREWGPSSPVVLRVAEPLTRVSEAIAEVRGPVASVSLLVLLVGGTISLLYSRAFSLRVRRLKDFSERVSEADFRPTPVSREGDEIEELAESLNHTARRLSSTIGSLAKARDQSDAILTSMSEGVAVVDASERVLYANRAFRQSLGLERRESEAVEGQAFVEVIREPQIVSMVERVLETRQRAGGEVTLPEGHERHFLVRAAPVGEAGAVVVLLDITDIRKLERVRRDFVANVSHELKTPLTAIRGFAETLLDGAIEEPENGRRFVEIIREHAERLGRLTEDLLKLSRIEAGKLELDVRPVDLAEIVHPSVDAIRLRAGEKAQNVTVELPGGLPDVIADADALTEVVQNLLANAVQYTPEGGHIAVRAERDPEKAAQVALSVVDDGIGIPEKALDRLFERFYRVDAARSRKEGGTGLGLSIAKHLMEAMGGRIDVTSELGRGSAFTLRLPCESGGEE